MRRRLLVHVGYHKTATTWMQLQLFTPEHGYQQVAGHEEVFRHLVKPHGLRFEPAAARQIFAQRLEAVPSDKVPVISSEILSGNMFFGGRESETYAERLKAVFPEARILISIRSQLKVLPSVYMQYLLRGGRQTCARFFGEEEEIGYFGFSPEHFEFDRLVERYQSLFGEENVYLLTQESLRRDLDGAVGKLAGYCGNKGFSGLSDAARRPHTPSYPEHAAPVLRRINHVQKSTLNPAPIIRLGATPGGLYRAYGYLSRNWPLTNLLKSRKPVSDHVRKTFAGRYSSSNARLRTLTRDRVDLSGYD